MPGRGARGYGGRSNREEERPFEDETLDATVDVHGPGGRDGSLHIAGTWFALRNVATVLEVTGTIGGRTVALEVPAT